MSENVQENLESVKQQQEQQKQDKDLLVGEKENLEKAKQELEAQAITLRSQAKVPKDPLLEEVEKKLEEVRKKLANKEKSGKTSTFSEKENFDKFKIDVDRELRRVKDKMEDSTRSMLRELDIVAISFKTDIEDLRQRVDIDLSVLSRAPGGGSSELERDLSQIQDKIRLSKEGRTILTGEAATRNNLENELKDLKEQITTVQQQREKLEQELVSLKGSKRDSGSGVLRKSDGASELETLKKQLADEEKEKQNLQTEIAELKEKLKKLTPAARSVSLQESSSTDSSGARQLINEKSLEINYYDIKIAKKISSGPISEVYEGLLNEERVVVKKLTSTDPDALKDFERELQIMCNSHSGYIVPLYGYNLHPPNMCLVMEYFPRRDLGQLLSDKKAFLPWERRWHFARDAALAINYLHSRLPPILHRDIKSSNFLISFDWKLKLTDFGAAIFKGSERDATSVINTTNYQLAWTAPEIFTGENYSEKSDVYSYSVVLFEIATRKQPWEEFLKPEEQNQVKVAVSEGKRPNIPSDVPDDFRRLIEQGWEQDSNKRPNMNTVLKTFNRKGLLDTASIQESNDNWQEEKSKLREELQLHTQLKENAENRAGEADKELERERRKRTEIENKLNDLESKFEAERANARNLERQKEETEKKLNQEKLKATDAAKKQDDFDKKYKQEKRKNEKFAKAKEEAESQIEEITKKWEQEKKKRMELQKELMNMGVSTNV
eukprot:TRINITY_DN1780_c0_g1_i4.p1 TRINITY_DN1780_c0_g1~~TRINITY_DN1780_c0_g1_i4.p1  ORF type:complete len:746 (+),score=238.60 TRINITY_DN1780_c0_g1_i4:68-2239(+)